MVKGGRVGGRHQPRKRARSKDRDSDESDEDFVISEEEEVLSEGSEDYGASSDGEASNESFDSFIEEEEEEIKQLRKPNRSRRENRVSDRTKVECITSRKRERSAIRQQVEGNDDGKDSDEDYDYEEEEEEEEEDDEFTLDEDDCSDKDDVICVAKRKNNMKTAKQILQKKSPARCKKRKRSRVSKKQLRKKRRTRKNARHDNPLDCVYAVQNAWVKSKKRTRRRKKSSLASSGSDFTFSVSSDYEYTISEEEREQVREAKELCETLRTNLRNSSMPTNVDENRNRLHQRKLPARKSKEKMTEPFRKGKEKIDELKTEVGKQVCGICLSEEDKRRVRGNLNCCSHYFCFVCIMEWAKVESRCPLCKQRFQTITKPARSTTGIDLREVVIQVPVRDQVYQPSEEELRSYIDPYECVICSECHQGGDDALMLLCDICDTPAHTFCVGLGREVPQGDWFCFGCRPAQNALLGSSSSFQAEEHVHDQRMRCQTAHTRQSPLVYAGEGIDLNLFSQPPASSQGFSNLSSPRLATRGIQGPSPMSGGGAPTLSGRRWIHRQIQQLLSMDRMNSNAARMDELVNANADSDNLYMSQINRNQAMVHNTSQDMGTSYHPPFDERLLYNNNSPLEPTGNSFLTRTSNVQGLQDSFAMTNGSLHRFNGRSNAAINSTVSPDADAEESNFHLVQSLVKSHLEKLSLDAGLCQSTFKEISRSCTHTLLAACGLEHKRGEVCAVPAPSVCSHIELTVGGATSLVKGCCSSCFDNYVSDVVKSVMDTTTAQWLRLGL